MAPRYLNKETVCNIMTYPSGVALIDSQKDPGFGSFPADSGLRVSSLLAVSGYESRKIRLPCRLSYVSFLAGHLHAVNETVGAVQENLNLS